ncbi:MAG: AmmeMemoRadiSam system protein A [Candidatus Aminicenantaceae bacterium]
MKEVLDKEQQTYTLKIARGAIKYYLETNQQLKVEPEYDILKEKRGAFVTLKTKGQLRGCIGYPLPYKPLITTLIDCAISASTRDYRFQPLSLDELNDTTIEISVLTLPKTIQDINEIVIGEHGIIISKGHQKGLLLPQVPVEWNWDLETYLRHGCIKAGLDEDEWKHNATIEIFSAQVFSE